MAAGNGVFATLVPRCALLATHANPLTGKSDLQVMHQRARFRPVADIRAKDRTLPETGGESPLT
jgi:hypothetical protein